MKTPDEIRKIADLRLSEAKILCENEKYNGAFYLAGYSIELRLKVKICEQWDVVNLFDFDGNNKSLPAGVSEVRKAIKTHDISALFILSGLKKIIADEQSDNQILFKTNSLLFHEETCDGETRLGKCFWNEQLRYQLTSLKSEQDIKDLIELLNHENGLLKGVLK